MMNVCSRILVAYDGSDLSEKALKVAMKLSANDKTIELHILNVLKQMPLLDSREAGGASVKGLRTDKANSLLIEIKESLYGLGNPVHVKVVDGHPEQEIVKYAEEQFIDLIIMGSRGLGGLKEFFLGSVSHYVVQHTSISIFIVK